MSKMQFIGGTSGTLAPARGFEAFFSEAVELALSPYTDDGYWDVMGFYIHMVKMLDAAALIRERGKM